MKPPKKKRPLWFVILKWGLITGVSGCALLVGTVAFIFWMYSRDPSLPDIHKLDDYKPNVVTVVVDANGQRIGELGSTRRTVIRYEDLPPAVVDAFEAAEDERFEEHGGVDYWGMFRAALSNIRGNHKQGASTITQQVVKNMLLTPEQTYKRKIQEIILARRLEKALTKHEIFSLYLNEINFGHYNFGHGETGPVYGIGEAARFYFGKDVSKLTTGEAAVLASLPKSPELYSPRAHPDAAKERQIHVLGRMVAMGRLTQAEAQKWVDAPIQLVADPYPELGRSPEWVDLVKKELVEQNGGDEKVLDKLGATVRTTLDPGLQRRAQEALQAGLRAVDARHGTARPVRHVKEAKIDDELAQLAKKLPKGGPPGRGPVEAVVTAVHGDDKWLAVDAGGWPSELALGTEDDKRFNPDGKSAEDRFKVGDVIEVVGVVGDGKRAKHRVAFAPGPEGAVVIIDVKTRKVRALVGGYNPSRGGFNRATMAHRQPGSSFKPFVYATAIESKKFTAASVLADAPEVLEQHPDWKPKNFETGEFEGRVRLRMALAKSINTVSLRVVEDVTPEAVAAMAKRLGISSELKPDFSLALGSHEVTPLEMTNAVATLGAGGLRADPQFIDAIDGKATPPQAGEQAVAPEVAYVVASMMESVVTEGTAARAGSVLKVPIAGKTGTSNDARDCWFIGMTPDVVIGVWIGYDDNRGMAGEQGARVALPVFIDIAKDMNLPGKQFAKPPHVVEALIDKATGLLAPDGASKDTTLTEVFLEGTAPTEVAPKADEVTDDNLVKSQFN
ncbi:MAG TPA: PBP1A family penicillin-binding protein [Kofleriaceae bacterium]|jgi:penicillin-binding protein 1A